MLPEKATSRLFRAVRGGILGSKAAQARRSLRQALGNRVLGSVVALGFLGQAPLQDILEPGSGLTSGRSLSDKIMRPIQRQSTGLPEQLKRTLSVESVQELQVPGRSGV